MELQKLHSGMHYQHVLYNQNLDLYVAGSTEEFKMHADDRAAGLQDEVPELQAFPSTFRVIYKKRSFYNPYMAALLSPAIMMLYRSGFPIETLETRRTHRWEYEEGASFVNTDPSADPADKTNIVLFTKDDLALKQKQGLMFRSDGQVATRQDFTAQWNQAFALYERQPIIASNQQNMAIRQGQSLKAPL